MTLRRGSVWRMDIPGDAKAGRPVIVISRNEMNRGDDALVIPTYTSNLGTKRSKPSYVFLRRGAGGLSEDCVTQSAHIQLVETSELRDGIGLLESHHMTQIVRALGWVLEADCRPS